MKKNKPINEIEFFPIDIKLPFSNDDGLPEYDPHFFEGIEIYDADVLVLHYILAFFIDYSKTFPEICNVDEVTSKRIIKDYSKAEEILIKLSKIDVPEVYKLLINKDITKIQLTRSILLDNGIKHKSIKDQMKRQAYLLFEYLSASCKSKFYYEETSQFSKNKFFNEEDFNAGHHATKIYKSIAEILKRVYPERIFPFPMTAAKVKNLIDNANKLYKKEKNKLIKILIDLVNKNTSNRIIVEILKNKISSKK